MLTDSGSNAASAAPLAMTTSGAGSKVCTAGTKMSKAPTAIPNRAFGVAALSSRSDGGRGRWPRTAIIATTIEAITLPPAHQANGADCSSASPSTSPTIAAPTPGASAASSHHSLPSTSATVAASTYATCPVATSVTGMGSSKLTKPRPAVAAIDGIPIQSRPPYSTLAASAGSPQPSRT